MTASGFPAPPGGPSQTLADTPTVHEVERAASLSNTLDQAWRLHFHAPSDAVLAIHEWRQSSLERNPENDLFALIIEGAGMVRTEPPEVIERLLVNIEAGLAGLAPSRVQGRLAGLVAALAAVLAWRKRQLEDALHHFASALAAPLEVADGHFVRHWRGIALLGSGKPQLAFRDSLAAREFFRGQDDASYALLSFNVGVMLTHAGDWQAGEESLREAFAGARLVRVPSFQAMALSNLAYCLINTGQLSEARSQIKQILESDRDGYLRLKPGDVLTTVAENLVATGHLEDGADYAERSLAEARERDFGLGIGTAQWNLGRIASLTQQPARAAQCLREALLILRHHPQQTQFWKSALAVSELYQGLGDFRRALLWHRRYHKIYLRWQQVTRDVRLAYAQALIEIDSVRAERDAAEAESARLASVLTDLEVLNRELRRRVDQVEKLQAELREQAIRDPLTGLLNRRGLGSALQRMIEDGERLGLGGSVAMLDLDRFKRVNDEYGHAVGDKVLAQAGQVLLECFRKTDVAFRYGGDEFCVLMPGADRSIAEERMKDFSERLVSSMKRVAPELAFDVTVSVGIALYPDDGSRAETLLDAADRALYRAKRRS
jgi:diguanylate cyclase (GGDEF)-like protein